MSFAILMASFEPLWYKNIYFPGNIGLSCEDKLFQSAEFNNIVGSMCILASFFMPFSMYFFA